MVFVELTLVGDVWTQSRLIVSHVEVQYRSMILVTSIDPTFLALAFIPFLLNLCEEIQRHMKMIAPKKPGKTY